MDNTNDLSGEFILKNQPIGTSAVAQSAEASENPTQDTHHHPIFPTIRNSKLHFLSSLCIDPKNITIVNQDKDEFIHLLVRRHLITNVPWLAIVCLLLFAPVVIPLLLFEFTFIQFSPSTIFSALLLYYLSLFGYSLLKFCEWYFHVGLVSNKRVVDVDLVNILSKNVSETEVKQVVDVTYTKKGILQSIFGFGNVFLQTEAVLANFEFDRVPRPAEVAEIVSQLSQHHRKGDNS